MTGEKKMVVHCCVICGKTCCYGSMGLSLLYSLLELAKCKANFEALLLNTDRGKSQGSLNKTITLLSQYNAST